MNKTGFRTIYHVDVNSAFLSWEAVKRLEQDPDQVDLREIPSAVAGSKKNRHGVILAKSAAAKACGVKTGEAIWQAQKKCPELVLAAPDYALYVAKSRAFIAALQDVSPVVEQYSIDEAFVDMTGTESLYGSLSDFAYKLKDRIRDTLGFTVNIGISCNKILAKMAGELEKPDRVITLFPEELAEKLWPLPVRELFMVGGATERKLTAAGICTIGQLAQADPVYLRSFLHKHGELIWNFANGRCDDPVAESAMLNKGYGNSLTTPEDICDLGTAKAYLLSLCETVGMRIRCDKQFGTCVSVYLRTKDFLNYSKQMQLEKPTDSTMELYHIACRLLEEMWHEDIPLRLIGVSLNNTTTDSSRQVSLFEDPYDRLAKMDATIDSIRKRFGEQAILRATLLQDGVEAMAGGLAKAKRSGVTGVQEREPRK